MEHINIIYTGYYSLFIVIKILHTFSSSKNIGISNLTSHPEIKIAAIGWEKENNNWLDYYFSIDPINGKIYKQYRSY